MASAQNAARLAPSQESGPTALGAVGETPRLCQSEPDLTAGDQVDNLLRGWLAMATGGVSIGSLSLAATDWALHLAMSPGKVWQAAATWWAQSLSQTAACWQFGEGEPVFGDQRFATSEWTHWPYHLWRDTFLRGEHACQGVTTDVDGVSSHHARLVTFIARQWLDFLSPSNCWWMNPTVAKEFFDTFGGNFIRGAGYLLEDLQEIISQGFGERLVRLPLTHIVGRDVAITPGYVVYRNDLFELIQYSPITSSVCAEPILFVPSWIMKYYILDLQSEDSMVRYLVEKGHTVFMMSWRNPGAEARECGLTTYLHKGILNAVEIVRRRCGEVGVHAVGYCLGGRSSLSQRQPSRVPETLDFGR